MNNIVTLLNEEFVNEKTGENIQGITIIVDGKLKEIFDLIIKKNSQYQNYSEIVHEALFNGISSIIKQFKE